MLKIKQIAQLLDIIGFIKFNKTWHNSLGVI